MEIKWMTMGMPAKLILTDKNGEDISKKIVKLFEIVDQKFSTYKKDSLVSKYNRGEIKIADDDELKFIYDECERTKQETKGFFDANYGNTWDPSGLVKGYAISEAAKLLNAHGYENFLIEIAGDIQVGGVNEENQLWQIGIENPFNRSEIVKIIELTNSGMATSGTSVHKNHIINPKTGKPAHEIASISVIASDVYDADRMATAAFAMGTKGIEFIHRLHGYSGYMITLDKQGIYVK